MLEREQVLSSSILWFVGACLWFCGGMAAASYLYPLSDPFMVPGPLIAPTLPITIGLGVALPLTALLGIGLSTLRQYIVRYMAAPGTIAAQSPIQLSFGWALVAGYWAILAICMVGLYSASAAETELATKYHGADLSVFIPGAFFVPSIVSVLLSAWRGTRPGSFVGAIAYGANLPSFALWSAHKLVGTSKRTILLGWSTMEAILIFSVVVVLAYAGMKGIAWTALADGPHDLWKAIAVASGIVGAVSLAGLAVSRKQNYLYVAIVAFSVALTCFSVTSYLHLLDIVGVNMKFLGGWDKYTPPMNFIIPSYAGGALCILAFMLLIVRYFFTFFTTVSIGGVTIGTMALVIVLSVMSGFESDLRGKILGFNAHIQISRDDELQFKGYQEVHEVLETTKGVVGYTPYLITEAYMSNHNNYGNVTMKGIDPARVAGVTEIVRKLEKGDDRALEKIWPLAEDGSILGEPGPNEKTDTRDDMPLLDDGPMDMSGGLEEIPDDEQELDLGELVDYSGGLDEIPLDAGVPDARVVAINGDGGVADGSDAGAEGSARTIRKARLDPLIDGEWETQVLPHDFIRPEIAILDGVLVGRELVKQINLYTDQEIRIISPLPDVSPDGLSIPRIKSYRIAGKFFSGMYEYDLKYVYCSLKSLQSFLDLEDVVNGIEVRVADPTKTGAIVRELREKLGSSYRIQDWKELNKALFSALKLEKIAMFFVLVIIVLVASFSIVGNLIMVVIEKAKEIAILKTLGSSNGGVMKIFITQGFFIGLVGTGLGVGLGLGACYLGMVYGVPLNPDVYYIDKLPILIDPMSIATVGFAGVAISVVATIYPAFIAARMRPVKGLRWD